MRRSRERKRDPKVVHAEEKIIFGGLFWVMLIGAVALFVTAGIPNFPVVKVNGQSLKLAEEPVSVASSSRNSVSVMDNSFEVIIYDQRGIVSKALSVEGYELGNQTPLYRVPVISMDARATKWSSMVNIPRDPVTRFVVLTLEYKTQKRHSEDKLLYQYVLFLTDKKESD